MNLKTDSEIIQMFRKGITAYSIGKVIFGTRESSFNQVGILIVKDNDMWIFPYNFKSDKYISNITTMKREIIDAFKNSAPPTKHVLRHNDGYYFSDIDVLPHLYEGWQKRIRHYMKDQFLEDLVKKVCHPSRAHTFEGLGFYSDDE